MFRSVAGVVELVDTPDLGSGGVSRGGSSPSARTKSWVLGSAGRGQPIWAAGPEMNWSRT